jgi:hypothetical protein
MTFKGNMDKKLLNIVLRNEKLFVPIVFTKKQYDILSKYKWKNRLTNSERKSLYSSIKKKMEALNCLSREQKDIEYYINSPRQIIPTRLDKAKKLIDIYSKKYDKVFISGSFLFSKEYGDIDIFIVKEKGYKEKWDEDKHLIFLAEKRLTKPVFQSAALISVSNFYIPCVMKESRLKLGELMSSYHEAAIEIRGGKYRDLTRHIVFVYHLKVKHKLLNGLKLKTITNKLNLDELEDMVKSIITKLYSKKYIYVAIHQYIKTLSGFIESEKNVENLKRYKKLYEEIIYGNRKGTART